MPQLAECNPMLRTTDVAATIAFYRDLLGFRVHSSWPEAEPCWCDLARDAVSVMFYTQDPHDTGPTNMTGRLYFRTDDVMTIYHAVKDKAEVLEGPEVHFYGMKEFALGDPNGYTLVFAQQTDEPPTRNEL